MTIDEILKEGERLGEDGPHTFEEMLSVLNNLPRLLAICKAAVEKEAAHKAWSDGFAMRHPPPLSVVIAADERRKAANAAFDAAVRGEGKEKEG